MSTAPNHRHAIAWLESKSRWFRARADLTAANVSDLTAVMKTMVFVAPVGDRVRHSIQLTNKNLRSLERELDWMSAVTLREAKRLAALDQRVLTLMSSQSLERVGDPLAEELAEYRANQAQWEERRFPPEPVPEEPDADVVADPGDEPSYTIDPMPAFGPGEPIVVQTGPATKERRVMEIATIRLAADHIAAVSRAMQDHQSAILRALADIPNDISVRLQRRLVRSRRSCSGGFERQAPRLLRQSQLLNTRIKTPGLVDGIFNPKVVPITGVPNGWTHLTKALTPPVPLIPLTEALVALAEALHVEMDVLLRVVKAVFGYDAVPPPTPGPATPPGPGPGQPPIPPGSTGTPGGGAAGGGPASPGTSGGGGSDGTTPPLTPPGGDTPGITAPAISTPGGGATVGASSGGAATGVAGDFVRGTGAVVVTGAGARFAGGSGGGPTTDDPDEVPATEEVPAPEEVPTPEEVPATDETEKTDKPRGNSGRRGMPQRPHAEPPTGEKFREAAVTKSRTTQKFGAAIGAVAAGTTGGVVMSNKKARGKIKDWKSYVAARNPAGAADEEGNS